MFASACGGGSQSSNCDRSGQVKNYYTDGAQLRCMTEKEYATWVAQHWAKRSADAPSPYRLYVAEKDFTLVEPAYGANAFTVILRKGVGMSAPRGLGHVHILREDGSSAVPWLGTELPLVVRRDGLVSVHRAGLKGKLHYATAGEYTRWLKEYLEAGGAPNEFYDYAYPGYLYFAEGNFTFVTDEPFYGSGSVEVIVPKGIRWSAPKGMGHSVLLMEGGAIYPKDEADFAFVPVYTDTMPKGLSPAAQKRLTKAIARIKAEEKLFWKKSREEDLKYKALEQKFQSELLPLLRPAQPADYKRWLKGYVARGGHPTESYGYPMPDDFYVAEDDFTVIPLRGSLAVEVIVPAGVHWSAPEGFGHVVLFLEDGYRVVGNKWVPTYSNVDVP